MNVTPNFAELCALLVDDACGELPSRLFAALLDRGPSTTPELCSYLSLPRSRVKNGLIVLVQQNLLYHSTNDGRRRITYYEANPTAAYNLIRVGRAIEFIAKEYGEEEAELVNTLVSMGSIRLLDLEKAYVARNKTTTDGKAHSNGKANGNTHRSGSPTNDWDSDGIDATDDNPEPESVAEKLSSTIIELLKSDIIEICSPRSYTSPQAARQATEKEVLKTHFSTGAPKGSKGQEQFMGFVREKLSEARDQPRVLREQLIRKLEAGRKDNLGNKIRKLENGTGVRASVTCADVDPNATIRVNFEKVMVLLRNQALVRWATQTLGHVTGQVYAVALRIIGKHVERCRPDRLLDLSLVDKYGNEQNKSLDDIEYPPFTTLDVVDALPQDLDVTSGVGKAPKGTIDARRADKIRTRPPKPRLPFIDEDTDSSGEEADEENEDGEDEDEDEDGFTSTPHQERNYGISDDDDPRIEPTREHLLLLAERSQRFLRHCGRAERGEWVVDFKPLVAKLRTFQVDGFIENKFSRHGLRLVNILRKKGKLDDKTLAGMALMPKQEALAIMHLMARDGIVHIQEVPKDNNRQAARTIYLWFFDDHKAHAEILDNSYKGMARSQQFLEVEQYRNKETLELFQRSDVKGREKEKLHPDTITKYQKHLRMAERLVNQIVRVDHDIVCPLRDF